MVTEPPATAIFNLTNSDRSAGQQDRRAQVTNGEADHFPQLQAASPMDPPQVPRNQTKTAGSRELGNDHIDATRGAPPHLGNKITAKKKCPPPDDM